VKVASGEAELALPQELSPGVYALNLNMYSGESHSTIWIHNER
jgi:hypothetical protein